MKQISIIFGLAGLTALSACGDGSPFANGGVVPVGTAAVADDTFTVTQGDIETILEREDSLAPQDGQNLWLDENLRATAIQSDDVLTIGGVTGDGTPFAGISGNVADAPDGDATFTGEYVVITPDAYRPGDLTLNFDFATGAITNDGGDLTVDATASEVNITGTVEFNEQSATLDGNFFGEGELAGAFTGAGMGGVIFTTLDE
ncbi:hypothetical protein SAMN04488515_0394 [Cognatiyoonia koreensis]|uniref:Transferrin-binding protein B C-lobe/N-lobe beta barrel domain-containing protein n=1 Tax=Cognatiyoonia koreensis TaxID=364200 RepID=A0A1I0N5G7_9RHOB|nr:hypothetical protein [Cognatiyoonia koreensis]SEV95598.1 hypothetical protein SAMN04488515_0394 [Cognatiyoonia koreensis]